MVFALVIASPIRSQVVDNSFDPGRLHATRAQLEELLRRYESAMGAEDYSEHTRTLASEEAELIRSRLKDGDFQVGDQIVLTVVGQTTLTNTFTVTEGPILVLPGLTEPLSLKGLLRSELPDALQKHIGMYIRNPQIQVQSNIRLAIFGQIANPGYIVAPSEKLLTDVLMQAGGPTSGAKQKDIRIKREGETIWSGDALQDAIVQGRTLDQLNLRAGDEIELPGGGPTFGSILQGLRAVPYIVAGFFALSRLF
jgi:hypothetical protein